MENFKSIVFFLLSIVIVFCSLIMLFSYIKDSSVNGYMAINVIMGLIALAWNDLSNKIDKFKK